MAHASRIAWIVVIAVVAALCAAATTKPSRHRCGARQDAYLASSKVVTLAEVEAWPASRRLWNNTVAMLGPLL